MLRQQDKVLGFIPLSDLKYQWGKDLSPTVVDERVCQNPVTLYNLVASEALPNFLGARVQFNYTFNVGSDDKVK